VNWAVCFTVKAEPVPIMAARAMKPNCVFFIVFILNDRNE